MNRSLGFCHCILAVLFIGSSAIAQTKPVAGVPHLQQQGSLTQLIVDGKPFMVLGGQLHNSSSNSLEYMAPLWSRLAATNLNTVLAGVSWELIEPEEGKFDFTLVDGIVDAAREHHLHLAFLWFGSWKGTMSTYAPAWVKTDYQRFPRVHNQNGRATNRLSAMKEINIQIDSRAFAALMDHLRETDSEAHTVIMMQVEGGAGIYPDARDFSEDASQAIAGPVPPALMDYLQRHKTMLQPTLRKIWEDNGNRPGGSWLEVFGDNEQTQDLFSSWCFGKFINRVAAAGKAKYPLPMFVNAALNTVKGGPQPKAMDIWKAAAPQIDFLCPDIVAKDFMQWSELYHLPNNPLFIPQCPVGEDFAAHALYSFGQHNAIGLCPFGIESLQEEDETQVAAVYAMLGQLAPLMLAQQGKATMAGIVLTPENPDTKITLGAYSLGIAIPRVRIGNRPTKAFGVVIASGPNEYIVAGSGLGIQFTTQAQGPSSVGFESVDDGKFVDGQWKTTLHLNGDEIYNGIQLQLPPDTLALRRVKLFRYQ